MIPAFDARGLLPAGIHPADWGEVEGRLGFSERRLELLGGLYRGLVDLKIAGCQVAYLDGSFASSKPMPGDYDVCWEAIGVDGTLLDPVLLTFANRREAQKAKYGGEFFPAHLVASLNPRLGYLEFFQLDKDTQAPKGIVRLELGRLP